LPLHDYQVYGPDGAPIRGEIIEKFFKNGRDIPARLELQDGHYALRLVSLPAKTSGLWHAGWTNGLDNCGIYSAALGKNVSNKHEEAKIMKSRGFIPESDLGKHWVDDTQAKLEQKWQAQADYTQAYQENLKTMSQADAVAATWSAQDCLSGKVDEVYSQQIKGV